MTPEEVEARFQRIEMILANSAQLNAERDRREEERDRREEERDRREEERDIREEERDRREEERDQRIELMTIGINALVESSIEYKRWKVETDQRFDILLQEIRATNQRVSSLENR